MGLFSFLTGKKDDPAPAPATAVAEPIATSATATPPAATAEESPFAPPGEWALDALTKPAETPASAPPDLGPLDPAAVSELQARIV